MMPLRSAPADLLQVDDRSPLSPGYMDVGLVIYRLDGGGPSGTQLTTIAHKDGEAVRNVLLETYLTEGEYVIVPITGGVRATPPDSYKVLPRTFREPSTDPPRTLHGPSTSLQ